MSKFFDEDVYSDEQEDMNKPEHEYRGEGPARGCRPYDRLGLDKRECNGGVSNEAYQNDYRNRKPFHYISEGISDGYYYWQFGATMKMEFILEDEVAFGDSEEDTYVPISDFMRDSNKQVVFSLRDFRGNEIWKQVSKVKDMIITDTEVKVYFRISEDLSAIMVPNRYKLIIFITEEVQADLGETQEVYNKCLTENGIDIRVRGV